MYHADTHPHDRDLLMTLDGESPEAKRAAVHAHVVACARCRDRWTSIEESLAETGALYARQFGSIASTRSGRERLEGALDDLSARTTRPWRAAFVAVSLPRVAAAGALCLALAIVWFGGARGWLASREMRGRIDAATALPIASLTPGDVAIASGDALCAGARPSRRVAGAVRTMVLRGYGMGGVPESEYELDALIPLELGGSVDPRNLWPQRYDSPVWSARVKDELERLLPDLVCRGELDLARAQRDMATDWVAAYRTYFKTSLPLRAHAGPPIDDHELDIAPLQYAFADFRLAPGLLTSDGGGGE